MPDIMLVSLLFTCSIFSSFLFYGCLFLFKTNTNDRYVRKMIKKFYFFVVLAMLWSLDRSPFKIDERPMGL